MQRQAMGQPIAHLIARLQSPEATNCIIHEGIIIVGKRSLARWA